MLYMGTECIHNQSSFHTSKESIEIDSLQSVGHCIRYANIKVFSEPHFPVYGQNSRTYTRKYVLEKTRIFPYFTQSDVFD